MQNSDQNQPRKVKSLQKIAISNLAKRMVYYLNAYHSHSGGRVMRLDRQGYEYVHKFILSKRDVNGINDKTDEEYSGTYERYSGYGTKYRDMGLKLWFSRAPRWVPESCGYFRKDAFQLEKYFTELVPQDLNFSYSFSNYMNPSIRYHIAINEAFHEAQDEFRAVYHHALGSMNTSLERNLQEFISRTVYSVGDDVKRFEYAKNRLHNDLKHLSSQVFESYWKVRKLEIYEENYILENQALPWEIGCTKLLLQFGSYYSNYMLIGDLVRGIQDELCDESKDFDTSVVKNVLKGLCYRMDANFGIDSPFLRKSFVVREMERVMGSSNRNEINVSVIKSKVREKIDERFIDCCNEVSKVVDRMYNEFRSNLAIYQKDRFPHIESSANLCIEDGDPIGSKNTMSGLLPKCIHSRMEGDALCSSIVLDGGTESSPNSGIQNSSMESVTNLENQRG